MIEWIKSVLLAVLVILSIGLSSVLWYATPNYAPLPDALNINQMPEAASQYDFHDLASPRQITVRPTLDQQQVLFPDQGAFTTLYKMFETTSVENVRSFNENNENDEMVSTLPRIEISFFQPMPIEYLHLLFSVDNNDIRKMQGMSFRKLALAVDIEREISYWVFDGDEDFFGEADISASKLYDVIESQRSATVRLPVARFISKPIRVQELSNSIFTDPMAIRQIQEKDQSVVYTDGSRGLRVNSVQQTIDFTDPTTDNRQRDLNVQEIVDAAIAFLNRHQSWVGDYVLASFVIDSLENNECTLVFQQQYEGKPIIGIDKISNSQIRIKMKNNRVTRMNRSVSYFEEEEIIKTVSVLGVDQMKTIIERRVEQISGIRDMYIAYYPFNHGEGRVQLQPVWVVEDDHRMVAVFDAETGQEIHRVGE